MGMQTLQIMEAFVRALSTTEVKDDDEKLISLRVSSDSSAARAICNRVGSGKVRHLSIKELWIQEEVRKKRLALDPVDTSMNWGDIGTKAHPKDRLDSLMSQLPLRRTVVGAVVAGLVEQASAEPSALPSVSWTTQYGDSYFVINLAASEVKVIVALVFVLAAAFLALCCWGCKCMKGLGYGRHGRYSSIQPDHALSHSSAAPAARGNLRSGIGRPREQAPNGTELVGDLNRYTLKVLQQKCMGLHNTVGGAKEEVARRLTTHMIDQGNRPESSARRRCVLAGMCMHSGSEGIVEDVPSSDPERLAAARLCPPARDPRIALT